MKKILCLILCLIFASFMLVSCDEEEIGEVPDHYPQVNNTVEDVSLNMYIIVEDSTSENAMDTVSRMIAQHTLATYHTEVNVKYVKASEYDDVALAAITSTGDDAANIVLVNSYELMSSFVSTGKLANLYDYLLTDKFGTLNVKIPTELTSACIWNYGEDVPTLYAIPNNHIVGEYRYLVINEEIAKQTLKENATKLSSYTTYESTESLRAEMEAAGYNSEDYVYIQNGPYSLKAELEANGNVCNVVAAPVVNYDEAYSSAFAIVDKGELVNDRAMEIVYALNSDVELRNLLQYGVRGTNYTLSDDGEILMVNDTENTYRMNLIYTGNVFVASYCDEIGWTAEIAESGEKQNADIVLVRD